MVFVHTRNGTAQTALVMKEKASQNGELGCFEPVDNSQLGIARNAMKGSRNKQLQVMFYTKQCSVDLIHSKLKLMFRNCSQPASGSTTPGCCGQTGIWWRNISVRVLSR